MVQFLPSLFQFATDSQPLVIFIAGIDDLKVFDDEFDYFCFIPSTLLSNIKVVVSIHKKNLPFAKVRCYYSLSRAYCTLPIIVLLKMCRVEQQIYILSHKGCICTVFDYSGSAIFLFPCFLVTPI